MVSPTPVNIEWNRCSALGDQFGFYFGAALRHHILHRLEDSGRVGFATVIPVEYAHTRHFFSRVSCQLLVLFVPTDKVPFAIVERETANRQIDRYGQERQSPADG